MSFEKFLIIISDKYMVNIFLGLGLKSILNGAASIRTISTDSGTDNPYGHVELYTFPKISYNV